MTKIIHHFDGTAKEVAEGGRQEEDNGKLTGRTEVGKIVDEVVLKAKA